MKKQLVFELTKHLFVYIKDQIKSNQHNFIVFSCCIPPGMSYTAVITKFTNTVGLS